MTRQNNNHKLTFALIGCGRISQVHLTVLSKEPRANLVAVADIDPQAASSVGETFGVKAFEDADTMLAAMHPDAVVICSPPNTHQELAEAAFSNGAHVLCEKPFTIHVEDAEAMVARSNDAGKVLMMASKFRYVDDLIKAKWIIDSGILGEI